MKKLHFAVSMIFLIFSGHSYGLTAVDLPMKLNRHSEMRVGDKTVMLVGPGVVVKAIFLDDSKYWTWVELKTIKGVSTFGWVASSHLSKHRISGSTDPRQNPSSSGSPQDQPSSSENDSSRHKEESTSIWAPGSESDPNYNPDRSPYNSDGERSLENEMRNETLHGVPYDPNNLTETLHYCTIHSGC